LTDVALQRELLIHRFGFRPSDIFTLTDQAATREGIELAFLTHLTEQARPGDIVVFHFSGFGSRVRLDGAPETLQQNSLVPIDGFLPTEDNPAINDLLEDTLGLLLRSLQTDQITTVLDVSYADFNNMLQGNLRIRSRPSAPTGQFNKSELAFQEQLLSRINLSRDQIRAKWQSGQLPGAVLAAAHANQGAFEGQWNGFSAGLFTYALTQQLWWATPATTLRVNLSRASKSVSQLVGPEQRPYLSGQHIQNQSLLSYYLAPTPATGADGVVTTVTDDGQTLDIWLAGLPTLVLEHYGINSLLSLHPMNVITSGVEQPSPTSASPSNAIAPEESETPILLQVRSRDGLTVKARPCRSEAVSSGFFQAGQFVWEAVRILPSNVGLIVALDASLERIERVDATSAFAGVSRVSAVVAGEQSADYLFGKVPLEARALAASLPADAISERSTAQVFPGSLPVVKGSYGLFNLGRAAVPGTLTAGDEAVKTAVHRIAPKLQTLLANKLLRLTVNQGSSQLGVRATLEMVAPQERIVLQQETVRAPGLQADSKLAALFVGSGEIPALQIGYRFRYRLQNYSDRPIYFTLLGLESSGNAIALYLPSPAGTPADPNPIPPDSVIPPGETLIIPQTYPAEWTVNPPTGLVETHLIFGITPLTQTFTTLKTGIHPSETPYHVRPLLNPLDVAQAVLQDLHQASTTIARTDTPTDTYALDVRAWATLSFVYRVIEG
jgi:hypothetical protein